MENRPPRFLRGLDAGLNRLGEALRAIEDRLRFDSCSPALATRVREIRHRASDLRRRAEEELRAPLSLWRNVESDSGAPAKRAESEATAPHNTLRDVLAANLARARESARSVEEGLRLALPPLARDAEEIRYQIYALEEAMVAFLRRGPRLEDARLYVIVTSELCAAPILETTAAALRGGAQMIQLREKTMENGSFLTLARALREVTAALGALFVINDRVEIAALVGADGVHLGQEDLPVREARKIIGPDAIVGVSTHSPEQARRAEQDGADYIGVGPIYPTNTKLHREAAGLEYIAEAARASSLPGFAIGGVNRQTLGAVLEAGAQRVAICTGIISAAGVEESCRWFRERLEARPWSAPA